MKATTTNTKKVYIAAPFRAATDRTDPARAYGVLGDGDYRDFLESIEDLFLRYGYSTCLPHRDEGEWGARYYEPHAIAALCYRHIETSDLIFAIPGKARGVHLELGFAAGLGKRLMVMHEKGEEPSTLLFGLPNDRYTWHISDSNPNRNFITTFSDRSNLLATLENKLQEELRGGSPNAQRRRVAIIDLGSHTLKFRAYSCLDGSKSRLLFSENQSIAIGQDISKSKAFAPETVDQLLQILKGWRDKIKQLNCDETKVVGTSAFRTAENSQQVSAEIESILETDFRILTPQLELNCVFQAVEDSVDQSKSFAVLNLGGGSTQIGIGKESLANSFFLPFGTRLLSSEFPWHGPFSTGKFKELLSFTKEKLLETLPQNVHCATMFHTGGELDFLLRCGLPMKPFFGSRTHVSCIETDHFAEFALAFSKLDPSRAAALTGIDARWLEGAVASNAIALALADILQIKELVPSNLNVSDGILSTDS